MMTVLVGIGILACVVFSALFSGSEMALSSCNEVRLENEAEHGDTRAKRVLRLVEKYDDALSAILVGNNLVNTAASSLTTVFVILSTGSDRLNWLGTVIVTVLVIIFGETVPKIVCKKYATRWSKNLSGFLVLIKVLFFPVNFVVVSLVNLLTKGLKDPPEETEEESVEELQSIIETAEDEGVLDSERSELVSAAIDFQDVAAEDCMTARVDMEGIDIEDDFSKILETALASTSSRLPVYEGSVDNVIGVVHLNHFFKALADSETVDVRAIMLPPCFVYRTMKLPQVLDTLKKARQHLAIVTDEYSGTLGVITMEDVLEQIVGDIWDETDTVEEEIEERENGALVLDGDVNIDEFLKRFDIDEDTFDYDSGTVGGWVIEFKGDFPEEGYAFTYKNLRVTVLEMDARRVEKLLVERV